MIVTVCLTLFFGKSDNLAAAYGIAVSATMLMTSALLFIALREIWGWGLLASGAVAGAFLCVDVSFFTANLVKVADGGYVPLLLASIVYGVMLIWHRGSTVVARALNERVIPISDFMGLIESRKIPRVPGASVFLTWTSSGTPPVMAWHVKHNRAQLLVLRAVTESIPWVHESERQSVIEVAPNFWRATARYGILERPDIPALCGRRRRKAAPSISTTSPITLATKRSFTGRTGRA